MIEYYNQNNLWKNLFELMVPESITARNYSSRQQGAGGKAPETSEDHSLNCEKEADRANGNSVEFSYYQSSTLLTTSSNKTTPAKLPQARLPI